MSTDPPSCEDEKDGKTNKKDDIFWWFTGPDYYSKDDIRLLRSSFSLIRENLTAVGITAFTKLFDEYPSAFKVFIGNKVLPETRNEVNYSWETKQHSLRVFHAIEKSLNRLTNPQAYRSFIRSIALRHVIYGAHQNHVVSLIGCLRTAMVDEIRNQWPNRCEESGETNQHQADAVEASDSSSFNKTVSAWNKFFAALSLGIISTMSTASGLAAGHGGDVCSSDENDEEYRKVASLLSSATASNCCSVTPNDSSSAGAGGDRRHSSGATSSSPSSSSSNNSNSRARVQSVILPITSSNNNNKNQRRFSTFH